MNTVVTLNQSTAAILDQSTAGILDATTIPPDFGHGTMVAGIVHLVAPTTKILPLKAFTADGQGYVYDIVAAIYYAVDVGGATVINMSFDIGSTQSHELKMAINYANSRGAMCVAAAGNSGEQIVVYPAANDNVFGVASTTTDPADQQSTFTNYGADASMAAPGEAIHTTYPGNYYAAAWGTSFSAPFVSGTIALLQQFNPKLSHDAAAHALQNAVWINSNLGWGRLDIFQAVSTYAK